MAPTKKNTMPTPVEKEDDEREVRRLRREKKKEQQQQGQEQDEVSEELGETPPEINVTPKTVMTKKKKKQQPRRSDGDTVGDDTTDAEIQETSREINVAPKTVKAPEKKQQPHRIEGDTVGDDDDNNNSSSSSNSNRRNEEAEDDDDDFGDDAVIHGDGRPVDGNTTRHGNTIPDIVEEDDDDEEDGEVVEEIENYSKGLGGLINAITDGKPQPTKFFIRHAMISAVIDLCDLMSTYHQEVSESPKAKQFITTFFGNTFVRNYLSEQFRKRMEAAVSQGDVLQENAHSNSESFQRWVHQPTFDRGSLMEAIACISMALANKHLFTDEKVCEKYSIFQTSAKDAKQIHDIIDRMDTSNVCTGIMDEIKRCWSWDNVSGDTNDQRLKLTQMESREEFENDRQQKRKAEEVKNEDDDEAEGENSEASIEEEEEENGDDEVESEVDGDEEEEEEGYEEVDDEVEVESGADDEEVDDEVESEDGDDEEVEVESVVEDDNEDDDEVESEFDNDDNEEDDDEAEEEEEEEQKDGDESGEAVELDKVFEGILFGLDELVEAIKNGKTTQFFFCHAVPCAIFAILSELEDETRIPLFKTSKVMDTITDFFRNDFVQEYIIDVSGKTNEFNVEHLRSIQDKTKEPVASTDIGFLKSWLEQPHVHDPKENLRLVASLSIAFDRDISFEDTSIFNYNTECDAEKAERGKRWAKRACQQSQRRRELSDRKPVIQVQEFFDVIKEYWFRGLDDGCSERQALMTIRNKDEYYGWCMKCEDKSEVEDDDDCGEVGIHRHGRRVDGTITDDDDENGDVSDGNSATLNSQNDEGVKANEEERGTTNGGSRHDDEEDIVVAGGHHPQVNTTTTTAMAKKKKTPIEKTNEFSDDGLQRCQAASSNDRLIHQENAKLRQQIGDLRQGDVKLRQQIVDLSQEDVNLRLEIANLHQKLDDLRQENVNLCLQNERPRRIVNRLNPREGDDDVEEDVDAVPPEIDVGGLNGAQGPEDGESSGGLSQTSHTLDKAKANLRENDDLRADNGVLRAENERLRRKVDRLNRLMAGDVDDDIPEDAELKDALKLLGSTHYGLPAAQLEAFAGNTGKGYKRFQEIKNDIRFRRKFWTTSLLELDLLEEDFEDEGEKNVAKLAGILHGYGMFETRKLLRWIEDAKKNGSRDG